MNETDSRKVTSPIPVAKSLEADQSQTQNKNDPDRNARVRKNLLRRASRAQRLSLGAQSDVGVSVIPEAELGNPTVEPIEDRKNALERLRHRRLGKQQAPAEEEEDADKEAEQTRPTGWKSKKPASVRRMLISFLIFVGLPTGISSTYYAGIASDQFASMAQFAIRSNALGADGTHAATPTLAVSGEMFVVKDYVASLQVLTDISKLNPKVDVRKIFSDPRADDFARLDPDVTDVQLLNYWNRMVVVNYDLTTGLGSLEVKAFTPEDSLLIANAVLQLSEKLVNNLTQRARTDTLALAQSEVKTANERVHKSIDDLTEFSKHTLILDPNKDGGDVAARLASLEMERLDLKNKIDLLSRNAPDSPQLTTARTQLLVIEKTIADLKKESTTSADGKSQTENLNRHDKLLLEREFSEKAYYAALERLDTAHMEVLRQGEYLEAFVRPQLATSSQYPQRLNLIVLTFICATIIWTIGRLMIAAILEHL